MSDEIHISPYDPSWARLFESERTRLAAALGAAIVRIDHVGSTSVPGLAAKPVIDVAIEVENFSAARASFRIALQPLGYAFWIDNPDPDHLFFVKGLPPAPARTHHVHVYAVGSPAAAKNRAFRDRLCADDALRDAYAALKEGLAQTYAGDREAYTAAKADFVAAALRT